MATLRPTTCSAPPTRSMALAGPMDNVSMVEALTIRAIGALGVMYLNALTAIFQRGSRSISAAALCYDKQRLPNY